jgi:hypothetical protein
MAKYQPPSFRARRQMLAAKMAAGKAKVTMLLAGKEACHNRRGSSHPTRRTRQALQSGVSVVSVRKYDYS